LLRIDDTDPARNLPGGEEAIVEDLRWLGVEWDDGPVRQSERVEPSPGGGARGSAPQRFDGVMLLARRDGSPTFLSRRVVDDIDFGITHVIRAPTTARTRSCTRRCIARLGTPPPHVIHHGLLVGADGKKLSKRADGATVASLREAGYPAERAGIPGGARAATSRRARSTSTESGRSRST